MSKTPEELAKEALKGVPIDSEWGNGCYNGFLAGYKAAQDQLADADKVIIPKENCRAVLKAMQSEQELSEQAIRWTKTLPPASERCNQCACQGYKAGYQAAAPQWISVKDRLPELETQVLVYGRPSMQNTRFVEPAKLKKRCTYGAIPLADEFWWEGYDIIGYDGEVDEILEVTHWQELPAPPKEEK